jgi:hypothetical protein
VLEEGVERLRLFPGTRLRIYEWVIWKWAHQSACRSARLTKTQRGAMTGWARLDNHETFRRMECFIVDRGLPSLPMYGFKGGHVVMPTYMWLLASWVIVSIVVAQGLGRFLSERLPQKFKRPGLTVESGRIRFGMSLALLLCLSGCSAGGSGSSGNGGPPPPPPAPQPPPGPGVVNGVFALQIPGTNNTNINSSYLIPQANVTGAVIFVVWSAVDSGNGVLDWSSVESQIAPWWSAGKKSALVVWPVSDDTNIIATPAYVLAQLPPTVSCASWSNVPEFTASAFQSTYTAFLESFFAKYGSDPRIAYIRVGMGNGGETYPACVIEQEQTYGLTQSAWQTYVDSILAVEHENAGSNPLMVALDCYGAPCPATNPYAFPGNVASLAAQYGFGIGSEGLQKSDMTNYDSDQACIANWCGFFAEYPGVPFRELQFAAATCADNSCTTGSPIELLPFAKARGGNVVEMTTTDLSIAFVPPPGQYTTAYQQAIGAFQ